MTTIMITGQTAWTRIHLTGNKKWSEFWRL